ncbi:MAG: hemerythrin domain-containing protein [Acidimicrobiia bacterium]
MIVDDHAPADTSMMRIVHSALRRDLERARTALTSQPSPDARQRRAIARHLAWVMRFLEAHHRSEDDGLYPVVLERRPDAASLLAEMAADHHAVAAAIAAVDAAAAGTATSDEVLPLIGAIDRLSEVLLPHLAREEDEVMPIVTACLTHGEWQAIEQRYNLDGKSKVELGREGHWLIDDAAPDDRDTVLGLVRPVERFFLLHGFGRSYRRRARACWTPHRRVQRSCSTSVVADADIGAVWAIVRDPTRVSEWSHECVDCDWIDGASEAAPGARFRGGNRQGVFRWGRVCEVVRVQPYEIVWRTVPSPLYPDSTEWTLRLEQAGTGTRIEQSFRVLKGTKLEPLYATLLPAHRDRTASLRRDLQRLAEISRRVTVAGQGRAPLPPRT